jgi:hypothetical protein
MRRFEKKTAFFLTCEAYYENVKYLISVKHASDGTSGETSDSGLW